VNRVGQQPQAPIDPRFNPVDAGRLEVEVEYGGVCAIDLGAVADDEHIGDARQPHT
jgi:D-arabinose 1-dehydrogenase-like Zn-dependent alcohol dehydrogenase